MTRKKNNHHLPADHHPEVPTPARRHGNTKSGPPHTWALKTDRPKRWKTDYAGYHAANHPDDIAGRCETADQRRIREFLEKPE